MSVWIAAALAGLVVSLLQYAWREPSARGRLAAPALLRAGAIALLVALLLDAPRGRGTIPPALVALDASASWLRASDTAGWRGAAARADRGGGVLLFGDSVRLTSSPAIPGDAASGSREVVDHALAQGRPLLLLTDGEVDDPSTLDRLPGGSRVEVIRPVRGTDAAVRSLDAPVAAIAGDTIEIRVGLAADEAGARAGTLSIDAGAAPIVRPIDALGPFAESMVTVSLRVPDREGSLLLRAMVASEGDREWRNDTLARVIEVTRAAAAVFASTEPDFDARYTMAVLRGALGLPTRGFLRVAPGQWRREGTLAPIPESEVRAALRAAPIAVLHGDTALFGPPRVLTTGALALLAPPAGAAGADWFAVAAPASPLAAPLAALPWDSLAPLTASPSMPPHDWVALETARARRFERRPVVVGIERPRRTVVVGASGMWRWQFRGGVSADAFTTLWGTIFDWLAIERRDVRAAVPEGGVLRAGEPVRWRRGTGEDSVVVALMSRRGDAGSGDTLRLAFGAGNAAESPPLSPAIYEVTLRGGSLLLSVNQSAEWLPRRAMVEGGEIGGAPLPGAAPPLRGTWWPYALVLLLLCVEWLWRRRLGLR